MKPILYSDIKKWLINNKFSLSEDLEISKEDFCFTGFAPMENAKEQDVSFWLGDNLKKVTAASGISDSKLLQLKAGLLFVPNNIESIQSLRKRIPFVKFFCPVENPYHTMVEFLKAFEDEISESNPQIAFSAKIHPTAVIEGEIGENVIVGPYCVVLKGCSVGANTILEPRVTLYSRVKVGENCIFQSGAVIGSRGFGFYEYKNKRYKVPHFGGVSIGNNCSIGANSVIAAGFLAPTTLGENCHIDAQVQIAHNCKLGNNVFMAAQSALAGSVIVGDNVEFAGSAKVADHIVIGNNVRIAAKAGVTRNISDGKIVSGFPAVDIDIWRRSMVRLKMLGKK